MRRSQDKSNDYAVNPSRSQGGAGAALGLFSVGSPAGRRSAGHTIRYPHTCYPALSPFSGNDCFISAGGGVDEPHVWSGSAVNKSQTRDQFWVGRTESHDPEKII